MAGTADGMKRAEAAGNTGGEELQDLLGAGWMKGGGWRGLARGSRWLVGWRAGKQQAGGQAGK